MNWIIDFFRHYPELAIFLTVGLGFWVGRFKYKSFTLGTVTSVLLIGVLVGQMNIPITGPIKSVFFLLFLFAIGYSVGPQFFRSLKKDGLPQLLFAAILCVLCLGVTLAIAKILKYNPGEAAGFFAGAQTISAVIGVGGDTISNLNVPNDQKTAWINLIPVCYAVTYIFGTIGSAWILGSLGPRLLGGLQKVKEDTKALEAELNKSDFDTDPAFIEANRPVVFRAYKVEADFFKGGKTIAEAETEMKKQGHRIFVERVCKNGKIHEANPKVIIEPGDEVVLSGRREMVIEDESWIGEEVSDPELLTFPVEDVYVLISKKGIDGKRLDSIRSKKFMHGVTIKKITRAGMEIPVLAGTKLHAGDTLELIGLQQDVDRAAPELGYVDRPTNKTDMIFVGLGILVGGIIGALTLHAGGVPISLSTSGGALLAGLFLGWLRTKRPTFGHIPEPAIWILNNVGLNMFIAVVGITAGPTFVQGLKDVGFTLFLAGIVATSIPLLIGIWMGAKFFKFRPAITLGCCAGSRTTTAALGAIQDSLESSIPAMGYTVTYAVGNTLLILMGVVMVLLTA